MGALVALATLHAIVAEAPADRSEAGVAQLLGAEVSGDVAPDDFVWEQSEGAARDLLFGRRVLFIGETEEPDGRTRRDVYRARVRVTRGGHPLEVVMVHALTDTRLGEEEQLVARGHHAAFVTRAMGDVAAVTLLDLSGQAVSPNERAGSTQRWASFLATGHPEGIGRVDVTFDRPPDALRLELTAEDLVLAVGSDEVPMAVRLGDGTLRAEAGEPFGAMAHRVPSPRGGLADLVSRSVALWSSDPARAEDAYAWATRWEPGPDLSPAAAGQVAPLTDVPEAAGQGGAFPPAAEGIRWELRRTPRLDAAGASALATASVPREGSDHEPVVVVAMDMRQLELRYVAGYETPRPDVAAPGRGGMPVLEGELPVVAAFWGGTPPPWQSAHGAISEGRLLALPEADLPTVAIDDAGATAFGLWPDRDADWSGLSTLRQGPALESAAAPDDATSRVALCADGDGHLVYAWARSATRGSMARALAPIECAHWLELGSRLDRAGFVTMEAEPGGRLVPLAVHPALPAPGDHFDDPSPVERFYLVLRNDEPVVPLPSHATWRADSGRQPAPSWIPSIHEATVENLGVSVSIHSFAPGRFEWKIGAGTKERPHRMGEEFALGIEPEVAQRLLASIRISNGRRKRTRGLAIDGSTGHRFRGDAGLLWVDGGRLDVGASREGFEPGRGDASELPLTADHGQATRVSRVLGARRTRGALCKLPDGTVLIASAVFDSHEATTKTLLEVGCEIVVALDRGTHDDAEMWRSSGEAPPRLTDTSTTLHVLEAPMRGQVTVLDR